MEFYPLSVQVQGHERPITLGVCIDKTSDHTGIQLLALPDNEGPSISKHLWEIREHVQKTFLDGNRQKETWQLRKNDSVTTLQFEFLFGQPRQLTISNINTLKNEERQRSDAWKLDKYRDSKLPNISKAQGDFNRSANTMDILYVPYDLKKPGSEVSLLRGALPYVPAHYNYKQNRKDNYETILVDTKKLADALSFTASHETAIAEKYIMAASPITPYTGNNLTVNKDGAIELASGDMGNFKQALLLNHPYVPVTVSKDLGEEKLKMITDTLGFKDFGPKKEGLETRTFISLTYQANVSWTATNVPGDLAKPFVEPQETPAQPSLRLIVA